MTSGLPEMPCAEFVERVTDYLEGALPPDDRVRLEEHLGDCDACVLYLEQLRETLSLTGELSETDVAPGMRDGLLDAFARWRAERP